jgi:hypothetical protein
MGLPKHAVTASLLLTLSMLYLPSCFTTQQVVQQPAWLTNRPKGNEYYIGIGSANKSQDVNQYQQTAKKNALNDLAGEISVTISNTSLLYKLSANDVYKETYDSKTSTTTQETIEGFEPVDSFEDKYNYWVYYRLSKSRHQQLKQQRIQKALDIAVSKYEKALTLRSQNQHAAALSMMVKAVEDIKPFMSEPLATQFLGKEIYFGNELINHILLSVGELKISPLKKDLNVKRGIGISEEELRFTVNDNNKNSVDNIPVIIEYSGGAVVQDKGRTSSGGKVSFSIPKVKSRKGMESVTAHIDMQSMLQEATQDFLIKKMLKNIKTSEATVNINVKAPSMHVISTEKKFDNATTSTVLKDACTTGITASGIELSDKKNNADFILEINANTQTAEMTGGFYSVILDATVTIRNQSQNTVYQRNVSSIKGKGESFDAAHIDAYSQATDFLKKRIIPDLTDQLF